MHQRMSRLGLALLVAGFGLQIVSDYVEVNAPPIIFLLPAVPHP